MSYEQHMKHSKNHRKDKFYQQCSGYSVNGESQQLNDEEFNQLELNSFIKVVEEAKSAEFPIYIVHPGGFYCMTTSNNLFAEKINTYEDLIQVGVDCVEGFMAADKKIALEKVIADAEQQVGARVESCKKDRGIEL